MEIEEMESIKGSSGKRTQDKMSGKPDSLETERNVLGIERRLSECWPSHLFSTK